MGPAFSPLPAVRLTHKGHETSLWGSDGALNFVPFTEGKVSDCHKISGRNHSWVHGYLPQTFVCQELPKLAGTLRSEKECSSYLEALMIVTVPSGTFNPSFNRKTKCGVTRTTSVKPLGVFSVVDRNEGTMAWKLVCVAGNDTLANSLSSHYDLEKVANLLESMKAWLCTRDGKKNVVIASDCQPASLETAMSVIHESHQNWKLVKKAELLLQYKRDKCPASHAASLIQSANSSSPSAPKDSPLGLKANGICQEGLSHCGGAGQEGTKEDEKREKFAVPSEGGIHLGMSFFPLRELTEASGKSPKGEGGQGRTGGASSFEERVARWRSRAVGIFPSQQLQKVKEYARWRSTDVPLGEGKRAAEPPVLPDSLCSAFSPVGREEGDDGGEEEEEGGKRGRAVFSFAVLSPRFSMSPKFTRKSSSFSPKKGNQISPCELNSSGPERNTVGDDWGKEIHVLPVAEVVDPLLLLPHFIPSKQSLDELNIQEELAAVEAEEGGEGEEGQGKRTGDDGREGGEAEEGREKGGGRSRRRRRLVSFSEQVLVVTFDKEAAAANLNWPPGVSNGRQQRALVAQLRALSDAMEGRKNGKMGSAGEEFFPADWPGRKKMSEEKVDRLRQLWVAKRASL